MEKPEHTPDEIAKWMLDKIESENFVYQETVVYDISSRFGEEFTYLNDAGNLAIRRDVLKALRKISEDSVVWERGERMWRRRAYYDDVGKRQQD